jgi:anti-anti-sigma regulatory factor
MRPTRDHVCWDYDDTTRRRSRVQEFLAEGLALGERVCYLSAGGVDALIDDLRGASWLSTALRNGSAQIASLETIHPAGTVADPATRVGACARATEEAVAAGYTGLRVAVEATALVRTPDQLAAVVRYEHLIDRYLAGSPFSALCAFNRAELGEEIIERLACLHRSSNTPGPGFRLHAAATPDCAAEVAGELDITNRELFAQVVPQIEPPPGADPGALVVDATRLTFIDHYSLLHLAEHARSHGANLVMRTSWPGVARIVSALNLPHVQIEPPR